MVEHTPGPWHSGHLGLSYQIMTPSGYVVANVADILAYKKAHEANARLIATAPDLLNACKGLLGLLTLTGIDKEPHIAGNHRIEAARAAIAKAEGKSC